MSTITLDSTIYLSDNRSKQPILSMDSIHQVSDYLLIHKSIDQNESYTTSFTILFAYFMQDTSISLILGTGSPVNLTVKGLLSLPVSGSITITNTTTATHVVKIFAA